MCQLGCMDVDPDPDSAGICLGSAVTEDLCFGGEQSDSDGDGLSTFCELAAAAAFAPELYFAYNDDVGREPRWAAMPVRSTEIRIAYLISYYVDNGPLVSCGILHEPITFGYPRAWVAFGKHANHGSDAACDAGGTLHSDESLSDTAARLPGGGNLNIGSRAVHLPEQDCMASSNPALSGNGVVECVWTNRRFSGWSGAIPDASAYTGRLADPGF